MQDLHGVNYISDPGKRSHLWVSPFPQTVPMARRMFLVWVVCDVRFPMSLKDSPISMRQ